MDINNDFMEDGHYMDKEDQIAAESFWQNVQFPEQPILSEEERKC